MFSFCKCKNPVIKADWINGIHCDNCKLPEGPDCDKYLIITPRSFILKEDKEISQGATLEELRRRLG